MSAGMAPAADLGSLGRFQVQAWDMVAPSSVEVLPGAMGAPEATHHVRVLDLMRGRAILVPLEPKQLRALYETLQSMPEANASVTAQPAPNGAEGSQQ